MVPWNQTVLKVASLVMICCIFGSPDPISAANPDANVSQPLFSSPPQKGTVLPGPAPTGLRRMLNGNHILTLRDFNFEPRYVNVSSQVDAVQVFKLALESFPFLSGLNIHFQRLEKWYDSQAKKIGLCGTINLSKRLDAHVNKIDRRVAAMSLTPTGISPFKAKKRESHWFPETISWRIGYDTHNNSVLGRIKVGRYISVVGETGSEGKVMATFSMDF